MMSADQPSSFRSDMSTGRCKPPDIILLSRSDDTWEQFQGLDNVADIALQGI